MWAQHLQNATMTDFAGRNCTMRDLPAESLLKLICLRSSPHVQVYQVNRAKLHIGPVLEALLEESDI